MQIIKSDTKKVQVKRALELVNEIQPNVKDGTVLIECDKFKVIGSIYIKDFARWLRDMIFEKVDNTGNSISSYKINNDFVELLNKFLENDFKKYIKCGLIELEVSE
jgi:hypothetical protein